MRRVTCQLVNAPAGVCLVHDIPSPTWVSLFSKTSSFQILPFFLLLCLFRFGPGCRPSRLQLKKKEENGGGESQFQLIGWIPCKEKEIHWPKEL